MRPYPRGLYDRSGKNISSGEYGRDDKKGQAEIIGLTFLLFGTMYYILNKYKGSGKMKIHKRPQMEFIRDNFDEQNARPVEYTYDEIDLMDRVKTLCIDEIIPHDLSSNDTSQRRLIEQAAIKLSTYLLCEGMAHIEQRFDYPTRSYLDKVTLTIQVVEPRADFDVSVMERARKIRAYESVIRSNVSDIRELMSFGADTNNEWVVKAENNIRRLEEKIEKVKATGS